MACTGIFKGDERPTRGFWGVQKYLQFLETFEQEPAWGIITNTEEELSLLTLPVFRYLHVLVVVSKIPMQYRIYYTKGKFTLWLIFLFHPSRRIISKTYGGGGGVVLRLPCQITKYILNFLSRCCKVLSQFRTRF